MDAKSSAEELQQHSSSRKQGQGKLKGWIWFAAQELDKLEQHLQSCHEPCLHHQAQNLRQDYAGRAGSKSLSVLVPVKRPAPSNYLVYVEPGWKEEKF